jgi:hypothetical protein
MRTFSVVTRGETPEVSISLMPISQQFQTAAEKSGE